MSYIYIKDFIKDTVLSNKNVTFGVEEILTLRKEFSNDIVDDKKMRNAIRNSIDELSSDLRFSVIKEGRKSICFNHNINQEDLINNEITDKKNKKYFKLVFIPLFLLFALMPNFFEYFFDKTFLIFVICSFLLFSLVLFHNEYLDESQSLSNKISLIIPIFGFLYYVLNDPVFSKLSYLSLDSHITAENNLYSLSISLFLAIFVILTLKNKLVFNIAITFIFLFPFFEHVISLYPLTIMLMLLIFYKFDIKKEYNDLVNLFESLLSLYKSKKKIYILIGATICTLMVMLTTRTDELKNSYYHHLSEPNLGFCNNLNYDLPIIKSSSKSNNIVIFSDNLYDQIGIFLFSQKEDVANLKPLDNDVIFTKSYFLVKAVTYNTILLNYQNLLKQKDGENLVKEIKYYIASKDKDYIEKNNKIIKYYINNHVEGQLFFYKCD